MLSPRLFTRKGKQQQSARLPNPKTGWLFKEGHDIAARHGLRDSWKLRFFVLEAGVLKYFKTEHAILPAGSVTLGAGYSIRTVNSMRKKPGAFVLENGPKGTPRRYKLVLADETAGVATSGWRDALEEHIAFYSANSASSGAPQMSQPARQKTKAKKKPSAISEEEEELYSAAAAAPPPPPPPPPVAPRPRADESDPVHAVMYANGKEHFKAREYDTALECFESCAKLLGGGQAMSYRQLQSYLQQARELSSNGSVAGSMSRNQSRQGSLVGSSVNGLARVVAEATRANDPRFASLSHTPSPRDTGNSYLPSLVSLATCRLLVAR